MLLPDYGVHAWRQSARIRGGAPGRGQTYVGRTSRTVLGCDCRPRVSTRPQCSASRSQGLLFTVLCCVLLCRFVAIMVICCSDGLRTVVCVARGTESQCAGRSVRMRQALRFRIGRRQAAHQDDDCARCVGNGRRCECSCRGGCRCRAGVWHLALVGARALSQGIVSSDWLQHNSSKMNAFVSEPISITIPRLIIFPQRSQTKSCIVPLLAGRRQERVHQVRRVGARSRAERDLHGALPARRRPRAGDSAVVGWTESRRRWAGRSCRSARRCARCAM